MRVGVSRLLVAVLVFLPVAAIEADADCMPTSSISVVDASPFAVKMALSHKWIDTADAQVAIAAALASQAPWYVQGIIDAAAEALALWIHHDDNGYGVFVTFYPVVGGWWVTGADSICHAPPPPTSPTCYHCCEWGTKRVGGKIVWACTRCIGKGQACP